MTENPHPQCDAIKTTKTRCTQQAGYRCSNWHHLCVLHTLRLGGTSHRRQTDRKCTICLGLGVTAKVEWLLAPAIDEERRAAAVRAERIA